jgi:hypothetical protein
MKSTLKTGSNPKIHKSRNKNLKNNKMKNLLILATMLLTFGAVNAQIGDCSVKDSRVEIYDTDGRYKTYFSLPSSGAELSGFSSTIIAITNESRVEIYDADGRYKTYFSLPSSEAFVKNVAGNNIMVKNGSRIETYDKDGRYVTYRSE